MLTRMTATDLAMIARNGGGFVIDGSRFAATDLAMIARNLTEGASMQIENSDRFTATDLAMVARNGTGKSVVFS